MAEDSNIEWTDHTFNPWVGCTKISAACDYCYAEAHDKRFGGDHWGPKSDRRRTAAANWRKPLKWNRQAEENGTRYRVFCASLADVFDNHRSIQDEWRADLWELIRQTPHLDWLLLTKRPQNLRKYLPEDWGDKGYANVWLGTTVENQEEAGKRLWHLLDHNAAGHFVSCEPLLGHVDLTRVVYPGQEQKHEYDPYVAYDTLRGHIIGPDDVGLNKLSWVICGGESGTGSRPMHPRWALDLEGQCEAAGVPFFFKQWGDWLPWLSFLDARIEDSEETRFETACWDDSENEWDYCGKPIWCQIIDNYGGGARCLRDYDYQLMGRVGKKAAGRDLDGHVYDQYPESMLLGIDMGKGDIGMARCHSCGWAGEIIECEDGEHGFLTCPVCPTSNVQATSDAPNQLRGGAI